MNPVMAATAKRNHVVWVKPEFGITSPRMKMMNVKRIVGTVWRSAPLTKVPVAFQDVSQECFTFTASVQYLTFRGASVFIARVQSARSSVHSVMRSAKIRFFDACLFTQYAARFFGMCVSGERIDDTGSFHVVVCASEVQPARAGWNTKVTQFFVDAFGVAINDSGNRVGRKTFNDVLLIKPVTV